MRQEASGAVCHTVTYTPNAEAEITRITYPSGFQARRTLDDLGRLTELLDQNDTSIATFDLYGAGGRTKQVTFGNATTGSWTFDGYRRPTDISHATSGSSEFAGFEYAWDANSNPLYEARRHLSGKGDVYTYDKANRLSKTLRDVDDPAAEIANPGSEAYVTKLEYEMHDVFNLTAYKVTPYGGSTTTTSYTTNGMNEYTAIGSQTPTYTDNGALADDDTLKYTYDAHDRLIEVRRVSDNGLVAEYFYDAVGLGRRTKKIVGSDTTRFVYSGLDSIEEYDGSGNLLRLFAFGERIDQVVMMEAPDRADVDDDNNTSEVLRFFFHAQLIGSITHVTGPSQSVVESYLYDPYGKHTIKDQDESTVNSSPIGNPYLFTGRQLDEETGLYYYRARHYSPELKRFIQRDPLEYVDGPNALPYVRSAPTSTVDPLGLEEDRNPTSHREGDFETTTGNPGSPGFAGWTWHWVADDRPKKGSDIGGPGGHWTRNYCSQLSAEQLAYLEGDGFLLGTAKAVGNFGLSFVAGFSLDSAGQTGAVVGEATMIGFLTPLYSDYKPGTMMDAIDEAHHNFRDTTAGAVGDTAGKIAAWAVPAGAVGRVVSEWKGVVNFFKTIKWF